GSGPLGTEWAKTRDPLYQAWIDAGRAAGIPHTTDYNGASPEGFGHSQYTIRDGRRASAATAYLKPARRRRNLVVETRAHVTRVLMRGTRAVGIEFLKDTLTEQVTAAREVILAAGAFSTPQLMMLSGIGPAAHLRALGIDVRADLPVGKNLQDHLASQFWFTRPTAGPFRDVMRFDRMALAMLRAYLFGSGPGIVVPGGLHAFIKTRPELAVPDIEFMFRGLPSGAHLWFPGIRRPYLDGYGIRPTLLHPESRGEVLLGSADPFAPMRIKYNFFSAPGDLPVLREGVRRARDVAHRSPMDPFRGDELAPGPGVKTDAEIDAWIRRVSITAHHPCGTCRMGTGADAVLDPELRVRGIEALRVADASAMPDLVSAHINACVIMLAEKASDVIRGLRPLAPILDA
ncbi:MAG TPA: GMC oxidoreductase, partial [Xanthobacteraceae bacterium]|nr:GMC oxidoreductase [Xanthobacteraceae bacterium]